ncbi:DUF2849 domain-containing protein [Aerophototrophica crusticola]|uniref:DUF2849 domain-containing protein n=1 Tax=Aerophototrophica crusticola TaxID=1709002 RepID=A0A858R476_9PROT|nr:DUF2849 domain-containing protein [Rhodospirillaceae bacterium B3]
MLVKAKGPLQSIAANRLTDGVAVWLGNGGRWVERVGDAAVFQGPGIEAALAEAAAAVKAQLVVDTYPIDVEVRDGETVPLHMRERMKALGPSVRPDLGKQAEPSPQKPAAAA